MRLELCPITLREANAFSGETTAALRARFGVSKTHIDHIKARKRRKVA